ncbi:two-component system sensor histidine kinase NtrB [Geobacter argillaceus]|uniref:histidine kinase n=1 Tax=Geobacter argillaceus TaxID=345631 RepID=A0A562VLT4_9BACT|nr:ATP-binding protein [Geobacter argillaceus]TWJ18751.1 two-component system sensor histidine kinase PilS (NtrC family) [Geobacter argillaceus]
MPDRKRLVWFILARLVVVGVVLASISLLQVGEPDFANVGEPGGFRRLITATCLFSLVSLAVLRLTATITTTLAYLQIIWDLLFITVLILLTGGAVSSYPFLYLLVIICAGFLLARREALYTACLCGILYGAIVDLQFYGRLAQFGLSPVPAQQLGARQLLATIFINVLAFTLTAVLTGILAERARQSESALQEREIDYAELEHLNSTIVSNLESGLLTVNIHGRIRVFNGYAAKLTGVSQEEAYDRPLAEVIPAFLPYMGLTNRFQREEIEHLTRDGERKIFGFKSVPFTDNEGNRLGVIIDFQDLTRLKEMESELKRADRLAAIGGMAARLAHEIRNPLASISGSVQLIAQGEEVAEQDRKLLAIVLRETDRLNGLISDFLSYARPTAPAVVPLNLVDLVTNLMALLTMDQRFAGVEVRKGIPADMTVTADPGQLEQVLWNLLVNAAEAMDGRGYIDISACGSLPYPELAMARATRITVRDSGSGMTEEERRLIFEPFFTTKSGGTGLGLATVYRIIEAHGGRILVESSKGEGTSFTILLPELPAAD